MKIRGVLKLWQLMRSSMGLDPPPDSPSGLAKDAMAVEYTTTVGHSFV